MAIEAHADVFVYLRQYEGETFLIALNSAKGTRRVDLNLNGAVGEGTRFHQAWSKETVAVESGRIRHLEIPPRTGRVFATSALS